MESITKNRQPVAALRAMVARAYGDAQQPSGDGWAAELGHGWFNVAYLIRLRDGQQVVLKIAPPPGVEVMTYEQKMMRTEVHALTLVRESTTVPVPRVHLYDDTHEICDADYFFMEYVEGHNLGIAREQMAPELYSAYDEMRGAANRELNQIKGDHFGSLVDAGSPEATWRQVFTSIVEDVLRDGERRGVNLGCDYDTVRTILANNAGCLDEVVEPAFVEWDLWTLNMLVKDGAIQAIIDHERALYADPLMEAGFISGVDGLGDPAAFMRGYGKQSLTPTETSRRRLYTLHLLLIMVIETVFRGHTEPTQYDWARERLDAWVATFG